MVKIIVGLLILFLAVIGLGVFGVYFPVWPTSLNDHEIEITPSVYDELNLLVSEKKFLLKKDVLYPGSPNEPVRIEAEEYVNSVISGVVSELKKNPRKSTVLAYFKAVLPQMDHFDSEEKDRALMYFGQVLDILNIESSNELFNVWRYGFPYGWLL